MKLRILTAIVIVGTLSACASPHPHSSATTPAAGASSFAGTKWSSDPGDSTMVFKPSGKWHEYWGDVHYSGKWQTVSAYNVVVNTDDGRVRHFTMSGDGLRAFRAEEPCGWNRLP